MSADLLEDFSPARLSIARRRRGLTRRALAHESGISERGINLYEQGLRTPTASFVDALARALKFPRDFFLRATPPALDPHGVSFRAMTKMTASQRDRAIAGAELALDLNAWLESRFKFTEMDVPDLRHLKPEAAADALRARWRLGDQPISSMVKLLESRGVRVFSLAEDGDAVDAFSFWNGDQAFVFLNTAKSAERSRFDAAHELGHLALHRHGPPAGREAEREAQEFASAFLMPRTSVLAFAPKIVAIPTLMKAKRAWGVALVALLHRLHDLRLVSEWHYRALSIEIQQRGYRKAEPESMEREMSAALASAFSQLRDDGITKHDVARNLSIPLGELNAIVFGLIIGAVNGGRSDAKEAARLGPRAPLSLIE